MGAIDDRRDGEFTTLEVAARIKLSERATFRRMEKAAASGTVTKVLRRVDNRPTTCWATVK